jgi:hypothetical protein
VKPDGGRKPVERTTINEGAALPPLYSILGGGCLQFFTATFRGDREEVELAVNSFYWRT